MCLIGAVGIELYHVSLDISFENFTISQSGSALELVSIRKHLLSDGMVRLNIGDLNTLY